MTGGRRVALAGVLAAVVALASAGAASADNSNTNTNNNDVTQQGDNFSGGDSGASEKTNWPPTDVGWPPKEVMSGGADNGGKGGNGNAPAPIVMPVGKPAPTTTAAPTTTPPAKPIVPAGTP